MTDAAGPRLPFQRTAATRDVLRHLGRQPVGQWTYGMATADAIGLPRITVKTILARLVAHGWCEGQDETPDEARARSQEMAGRRGRHTPTRRYYRLTALGRAKLDEADAKAWLTATDNPPAARQNRSTPR